VRTAWPRCPPGRSPAVAYEDLVLDEDLAILERYRDRSLALDLNVEVQRQ
jgi:hypothetical protein